MALSLTVAEKILLLEGRKSAQRGVLTISDAKTKIGSSAYLKGSTSMAQSLTVAEKVLRLARVPRLSIETMLEVPTPNLWEGSLSRIVDFGSQWVAKGAQLSRHREQLARFRPARRRRGVAKWEGAGAPSAGIFTGGRLAAPLPSAAAPQWPQPALSERLAGK